jgi:putative nucleotidyltransferase with HDIG domain
MDDYRMLEHIKAHSVVVTRVARLLVRSLNEAGLALAEDKTVAAALLHDIGKTASLESGQDHSELGKRICLRHGFHEIAEMVGEHVRLNHYDLMAPPMEKEIVYYADKRVNHDVIVSLEERLEYILERYGGNQDWIRRRIHQNFEQCRRIEEKLFSGLNFGPETVAELAVGEDVLGVVHRRDP